MFPVKKFLTDNLKKIKLKLKQLVALRASKHQISLGVGIGVFIGVFPTFGFGALVIALLSPFFKFNIPAALIGTLIANPFTMPLWFFLSCWVVGLDRSSIKITEETLLQIFKQFSGVLLTYLIGVTIVSICAGLISYICTRLFLQFYLTRRKKTSKVSQ